MNDPQHETVGRVSFGSSDNRVDWRAVLVIVVGLLLHALALAIFLRWAKKQ